MYPDRTYIASGAIGELTCEYTPNALNPDCGCIVGEALRWLGVPIHILELLDSQSLGSWGVFASALDDVLRDHVAPGAVRSDWVSRVQHYQDEGHSWAQAVALADQDAGVVARE